MHSIVRPGSAAVLLLSCVGFGAPAIGGAGAERMPRGAQGGVEQIDLGQRLSAGRLRAVNRVVSALQGTPGAVTVTEKEGDGIVWIENTDFALGTIEVDIRGRDVTGRSFVGIAFHRRNDQAYEVVYLRPFNFRSDDPLRHQHAVQYMMMPEFEWPRLRKEFPEEFENPVDKSVEPTGWVPLRVVMNLKTVQIYVGKVTSPTLEVRKLGNLQGGQIGLWAGNGSDGAFANLRVRGPKS
jgi:hypothetical protein